MRADVTGTDLVFVQIAVNAVATDARDGAPVAGRDDVDDLHRRYLWIALDGMRAHDGRASRLPVASLTTAQTHTLLQPPSQTP